LEARFSGLRVWEYLRDEKPVLAAVGTQVLERVQVRGRGRWERLRAAFFTINS
jgi:hypothetical protein